MKKLLKDDNVIAVILIWSLIITYLITRTIFGEPGLLSLILIVVGYYITKMLLKYE